MIKDFREITILITWYILFIALAISWKYVSEWSRMWPGMGLMFRGIGRGKGWKLLVEFSWKDIMGIGLDPLSLRTYVFIKQLCVETGQKADLSGGKGLVKSWQGGGRGSIFIKFWLTSFVNHPQVEVGPIPSVLILFATQ